MILISCKGPQKPEKKVLLKSDTYLKEPLYTTVSSEDGHSTKIVFLKLSKQLLLTWIVNFLSPQSTMSIQYYTSF